MQKVVVIGIDGMTPELLEPWIKKGYLKNFKKLQENGVYGRLKSTVPPFSAPSWVSIVSGCSPGKHSIYGFESTNSLDIKLISSRDRKTPAYWNYFTDIGLKNIIVNVPVSYPPEKINGVMITGLMTPSEESTYTYPKELKQRLTAKDLGEYKLEAIWLEDFSRARLAKNQPEKLLNLLNAQLESRANVTIKFMKSMNWDFTMVVLRATDTAQHFLFHEPKYLLNCYQKVDELIGKIIETEPDATYYIVSDHGFQQIETVFYPDVFLYMNNLLKPSVEPFNNPKYITNQFIYHLFQKIIKMIPKDKIHQIKIIKELLFSHSSRDKVYDFSKTKAFSIAEGRGIQLNLKTRYEKGIVSEDEFEKFRSDLIKLIKDIKDPEGNQVISNIYTYEELYGKDAIDPPDIILELAPGFITSEGMNFNNKFIEKVKLSFDKSNLTCFSEEDVIKRSGDHSQYGIFFAYGNNINKNKLIENIQVYDILPHVFSSLNIPIPKSSMSISSSKILLLISL